MPDIHTPHMDQTPTVEVLAFRDGDLVHSELCESEEQAALVIETWADVGMTFEVRGLSDQETEGDDVDLGVLAEADYPRDLQDAFSTRYES